MDAAATDADPLVVTLTGPRRVEVLRTPRAHLPAALAADAYALLDADPAAALQVVLDFRPGRAS
jgi:hypothetical protein